MGKYLSESTFDGRHPAAIAWRMVLMLGIAGVFILGIMGYGFYAGSRINVSAARLVNGAMKIKLEAVIANLLFEELIADAITTNPDTNWEPLEQSVRALKDMLIQSDAGKKIFRFDRDRSAIWKKFQSVEHHLSELRQSARQRLAEETISFLSQDAEQRYREVFKAFMSGVDRVHQHLQEDLTRKLLLLRRTQMVLLGTCFILLLTICVAFLRFERRKARDFERIHRANEQMTREMAERKRAEHALAERSKALEISNQALEQFAYAASHDLQEPLRMVVAQLQLLERRYKNKLGPDADNFIRFAVDGANRMLEMIKSLLSYSRVGFHTQPLELTSMEDAFHQAVENLYSAVAKTRATITHDKLPQVRANTGQMTQLFQNLIGNALKFCSDKPPEIHVSARQAAEGWEFSVRDNGIGIDPRFSEHIFDVFKRLHGIGEYPGTGIGLAICKRIVDCYNGKLWVSSTPGTGSTFYFILP